MSRHTRNLNRKVFHHVYSVVISAPCTSSPPVSSHLSFSISSSSSDVSVDSLSHSVAIVFCVLVSVSCSALGEAENLCLRRLQLTRPAPLSRFLGHFAVVFPLGLQFLSLAVS